MVCQIEEVSSLKVPIEIQLVTLMLHFFIPALFTKSFLLCQIVVYPACTFQFISHHLHMYATDN